jgi:hypothetical protein
MYYQFDKDGVCISSSTYPTVEEAGIVSVYTDAIYSDIENLALIDGEVVHLEPKEDDVNGTEISS